MQTHIIPRAKWASFFEGFSREHEGWLVTLEVSPHIKVFTAKIGDQIEADHLALGGITAEVNPEGEERIEIMLGTEPEDHVTHNIVAPTEVSLIRTGTGEDVMLEIRSFDGATTVLRLLSPMLPEMLDGFVAESLA